MKKVTLLTMLSRLEGRARNIKNEAEQAAQLTAIEECRAWVGLPWAEMEQPVLRKLQDMKSEGLPLIEKEEQNQLSLEEGIRLNELLAAAFIYVQFLTRITPTALRARSRNWARLQEKIDQSPLHPIHRRQMALESRISSDVEEHGFFVMGVFDPEGQLPLWGYTIGLHHTNPSFSEIIVIGLPMQSIEGMLRTIANKMLKEQEVFEAGQTRWDLTVGGYPCFFAPVDQGYYEEYVGQGINYYARQPFPLLQCVWCDTQKLFPWQSGFQEEFRAQQPLLFDIRQYATE